MTANKPRTGKRRSAVRKQKCVTLVEEVEALEHLAPRMQELLLDLPEGSRIYLRVRGQETVH
jgi:hypothetical protein